jgi:AcrR family transcriptional regulator
MRISPEKKEDRERVAHALLRVTLQLASAHGFVSLGLREVSRAADIAPTSFYRHFTDMEELGRELIEHLAGPFIEGFLERAQANPAPTAHFAVRVAREAIARAVEDPELMRFILAERTGAISAFRSALAKKVAVVSSAVTESLSSELAGVERARLAVVGDAIVILVFSACADVLDGGAETAPAHVERVSSQIHLLLAGASPVKGRK